MRGGVRGFLSGGIFFLILHGTIATSIAKVTIDSVVSVNETYTDNLFFTSTNKDEDFGTFITPLIRATYETRDVVLRGVYGGTAQLFVNNSNANTFTQNVNLGIGLPFLTRRFNQIELRLIETFNFTPQLPAFALGANPEDQENISLANLTGTVPGAGGVNTVGGTLGGIGDSGTSGIAGASGVNAGALANQGIFVRRTTGSFQNLAGFNLQYLASERFKVFLSYRNSIIDFSDPQFQDSVTHTIQFGPSYNLTRNTRLRVSYRARIADFSGAQTITTHAGLINLIHTISPTVTGRLRGGISSTDSDFRVLALASILKQYQLGILSLRFAQDIGRGGGVAPSVTLNRAVVAQATRNFTRTLMGFLFFGYTTNNSLSGNFIDIETFQARAGLNAQVLSWLRGSVSYGYINQDSKGTSLTGVTAQRNQVFLGLSANLPPWQVFK